MLLGRGSAELKMHKFSRVTGIGIFLRVTTVDWKSISSKISSS